MATKAVSDSNFESLVKENSLVLVDFWAEWCGPCRALGPKLEELSDEMGEKISILKLNVDENPDTAARFKVKGIPTMILFKEGQDIDTIVGNQSKENIQALIEKHM